MSLSPIGFILGFGSCVGQSTWFPWTMCAAKADWIADEKDESGITCTKRVMCCANDTGNASQCVPARQLLIWVWIHCRGKQPPSVAQPCSRCVLPWKKDNKLNPLKSISSSPSAESQLRFSMVIEDFAIKSNPSHAHGMSVRKWLKVSAPPCGSEVTGLLFADLTVQAGKGKWEWDDDGWSFFDSAATISHREDWAADGSSEPSL